MSLDVPAAEIGKRLPVTVSLAVQNQAALGGVPPASVLTTAQEKAKLECHVIAGNRVFRSTRMNDRSWMPNRDSPIIRTIFLKRSSVPVSRSKAERASKFKAMTAKTIASNIGLYELSKGQLMKTEPEILRRPD